MLKNKAHAVCLCLKKIGLSALLNFKVRDETSTGMYFSARTSFLFSYYATRQPFLKKKKKKENCLADKCQECQRCHESSTA